MKIYTAGIIVSAGRASRAVFLYNFFFYTAPCFSLLFFAYYSKIISGETEIPKYLLRASFFSPCRAKRDMKKIGRIFDVANYFAYNESAYSNARVKKNIFLPVQMNSFQIFLSHIFNYTGLRCSRIRPLHERFISSGQKKKTCKSSVRKQNVR